MRLTVAIYKEEIWYVAKCIQNSIASQGKTIEEAISNLKEALELYYEDIPKDQIFAEPEPLITSIEVGV
ncbi:MAG TPA: type II toxin-antitoxin system HicB family antitoxin [Petrotogaceae bacterium]|nr:type II toxin-antitoxin system HicB family antitoxin [Petrotogaceae bacterium]HQF32559.1 type II toxin-antitoxin system HicB family antitoxin [Petrotogaceae bacterium]HQH32173.1 type II toxin-antitoxin system HicB family antitoxin [Petrotogaceae bacterium]HQI79569.1 type II toxin-antitoxin system HicB family antitoxin [Petrotogaceae bacterium]